jgi:ABC-2 type transport system ATP-binding protein
VRLVTWEVSGPHLVQLADQLRRAPGILQAVAFGNSLHVSGDDSAQIEKAISTFRSEPYAWRQIEPGLEDVFIHLMEQLKDNAAA